MITGVISVCGGKRMHCQPANCPVIRRELRRIKGDLTRYSAWHNLLSGIEDDVKLAALVYRYRTIDGRARKQTEYSEEQETNAVHCGRYPKNARQAATASACVTVLAPMLPARFRARPQNHPSVPASNAQRQLGNGKP